MSGISSAGITGWALARTLTSPAALPLPKCWQSSDMRRESLICGWWRDMALCPANVISLCTGGGGLDLGLELAVPDARTVCMVEREAFAVAHLVAAMWSGLMAECPVWSDVTTFNGRPWRGTVDWVIGGIPCQPHSAAGKRLGRDDERDLWADARRIIVQSRPQWVLIENVEGMLSTGGAQRVVNDLERLGFIVEGGLFSAAEVGFTHQRKRVFILAYSGNKRRQQDARSASGDEGAHGRWAQDDNQPECGSAGMAYARRTRSTAGLSGPHSRHEGDAGQPLDRGDGLENPARGGGGLHPRSRPAGIGEADAGGAGGDVEHADGAEWRAEHDSRGRLAQRADGLSQRKESAGGPPLPSDFPLSPPGPGDIEGWRAVLKRAPELEPAVCRVADGMASRVDRLRMLGNGVHPLAAAYAIRTLVNRIDARCPGAAELVVRAAA